MSYSVTLPIARLARFVIELELEPVLVPVLPVRLVPESGDGIGLSALVMRPRLPLGSLGLAIGPIGTAVVASWLGTGFGSVVIVIVRFGCQVAGMLGGWMAMMIGMALKIVFDLMWSLLNY